MRQYLLQLLLALDQLANAVLGGFADETLSARAYRADMNRKVLGRILRPLIDTLFFWETRHCYNAYLSEVQRRQSPAAYGAFVKDRP